MNRKAILVLLVTAAVLIAAPQIALAQSHVPLDIPQEWRQPLPVANNAVVRAIMAVARFVLPIFGAYVVLKGLWALIKTVGDVFSGKGVTPAGLVGQGVGNAVASRLLEIVLGLLLVAIPLSGLWVPLVEGLLRFAQAVIDAVSSVLSGAGAGGGGGGQ